MEISWGRALWRNFLGQSPDWYKLALIILLTVNLLILLISPFVADWLLIAEFIFTLAMALKCYLLLPGGPLVIEAVFIDMISAEYVREEVAANLEVSPSLMFMAAGTYLMKQLLLLISTRLLLSIYPEMLLSLFFCVTAAFLSALLDVLTVVTVVISVAVGFYGIYHRVTFSRTEDTDLQDNNHIGKHYKVVLEQFCGFLRSLMMHAGVGTVLGGVMTIVDEPQNLIIAKAVGQYSGDFFLRMLPVTVPVLICGLLTCLLVEKLRWFGYGETPPEKVREVPQQSDDQNRNQRTRQDKIRLIVQAIIGIWLVIALVLHLAEVGLTGLSVIILATPLIGVTDGHVISEVFAESLPFTALLTVSFSVVATIIDQQLFSPIIQFVLQASEYAQLSLFCIFNGLLSFISDNVSAGTTYINEAKAAMESGATTLKQYELLTVAINTGTSLPSVVAPNGQVAFLFLLVSIFALSIRLSYGRMMWMVLPHTLILTLVGLFCVEFMLAPVTEWFMQMGWIAML